jgi:NAD(P)-dependent dehydrogenase (short-subunit alcohol dehydrogenase family)
MRGLRDQLVLVTGATSGLGRASVARLLEEGARVIVVGRNAAALEELAAAHPNGVHSTHVCDLAQTGAGTALMAALRETGPITGWVLAAGIQELRPLMMESWATLERTWAANVASTLALIGAALKSRKVARGGSLVLFSSAAASAGGAGLVSYAASKGAIEAAVRSLALELAPQAVRVNAIAPGVIPTPMSEKYLSKLTADQIERLKSEHPLGFGTPEDVAAAVAFLLSSDARWITGAVLQIDGGLSAH